MADKHSRQPDIGDYAFISDCHSAALVSRRGSIDWCCMPRMDAGSMFGRLLDSERGGYSAIDPGGHAEVSRQYLGNTLVLATTVRVDGGEARIIDCFTVHRGGATRPHHQLLRTVEGVRGRVRLRAVIACRFDYGEVRPWLRLEDAGVYSATGGNDAAVIHGDLDLFPDGKHDLVGDLQVRAGQRARLSIVFCRPEQVADTVATRAPSDQLDERLAETRQWWERWSHGGHLRGPDGPAALRSAITLRGLTIAPTGAMAAAPTTSLPEATGGPRNWDYRYSWVHDSCFAVRALAEMGFEAAADGFRQFVERSAAGSAEELQIMYGLGGERRLTEVELDSLSGYRGARPVRVGNAASRQLQLDVYGELLDLAWRWHRRGRSPDDDMWRFLVDLIDTAATRADQPDRGIWELRGDPRHLTHSKVMCWAALDRGLSLAKECGRKAPERRWSKARRELRALIEHDGYDPKRGVFTQTFGAGDLDAALLRLPTVDFVDWDDERMVRTVDAIITELSDGGLIRRYRSADGLDGQEGTFLACTFWLVECLARQDRAREARAWFDRAAATANDVGLYAEEFDPASGQMLGNFPQALTHLSHISAAVALAAAPVDEDVTEVR